MAYAFVQQIEVDNTSPAGSIASGAFTVTAGNALIAVLFWGNAGSQVTVQTPAGWTAAADGMLRGLDQDVQFQIFYRLNHGGGAGATTWTFNGTPNFSALYIAEYSGIATSAAAAGDVTNEQTNPGTGTDAITTGDVTPGGQPALVFGFVASYQGAATPSAGTGYTSRTAVWDFGGGTMSARPMDKRITSTSATAVTGTSTAGGADSLYSGILILLETSGGITATPSGSESSAESGTPSVVYGPGIIHKIRW